MPVSFHILTGGHGRRPDARLRPRDADRDEHRAPGAADARAADLRAGVRPASGAAGRVRRARRRAGWRTTRTASTRCGSATTTGSAASRPGSSASRPSTCARTRGTRSRRTRSRSRPASASGLDRLMWASDYPHSDSTWPHSQKVIERDFSGIPEADLNAIVSGNAQALRPLTSPFCGDLVPTPNPACMPCRRCSRSSSTGAGRAARSGAADRRRRRAGRVVPEAGPRRVDRGIRTRRCPVHRGPPYRQAHAARHGPATARGPVLGLRFGMTGRLLVRRDRGDRTARVRQPRGTTPAWDRFTVHFADGGDLRDARPAPARRRGARSRRGPASARTRSRSRPPRCGGRWATASAPLKARLMDQARVAGMGNLLTDETLWRAGLDPARPAGSLTDAETPPPAPPPPAHGVGADGAGRFAHGRPARRPGPGRPVPPGRPPAGAAQGRRAHDLLVPGAPNLRRPPGTIDPLAGAVHDSTGAGRRVGGLRRRVRAPGVGAERRKREEEPAQICEPIGTVICPPPTTESPPTTEESTTSTEESTTSTTTERTTTTAAATSSTEAAPSTVVVSTSLNLLVPVPAAAGDDHHHRRPGAHVGLGQHRHGRRVRHRRASPRRPRCC